MGYMINMKSQICRKVLECSSLRSYIVRGCATLFVHTYTARNPSSPEVFVIRSTLVVLVDLGSEALQSP